MKLFYIILFILFGIAAHRFCNDVIKLPRQYHPRVRWFVVLCSIAALQLLVVIFGMHNY